MSIRWQCKCGQPLEVPDGHPQRVVTCPKCIRSVSVPVPEEPLSPEARSYLEGKPSDTRMLAKPIKCLYCGWLVWSANDKNCPKCLRKLERHSVVTTIVSWAVFAMMAGGGWYYYQNHVLGEEGKALQAAARQHVAKLATDWGTLDDTERAFLEETLPGALSPGKEAEYLAEVVEARMLGMVDGRQCARVTYRVTLILVDPAKPAGDPARRTPRAAATVEQKLRFDRESRTWVAAGKAEVVDRKM